MRAYLLLAFAAVAPLAAADATRDARWMDDLEVLATELPALHPNLFFQSPRSAFDQAVRDLREAIPTLNDAEVMTGLARIAALAGDGHTNIMLNQRDNTFRLLPLAVRWFDDGLYVISAGNAYPRALGARVVRIGRMTAEEAYRAVAPIVSHETDAWVREISPYYLVNAEILQALKVTPDNRTVAFEFEDRAGARFTLDIASNEPGRSVASTAAPDTRTGFVPLWRQRTNENYWFTYLESARTLYFAYNTCQEMAGRPFAEFNAQLWAVFDSKPVERVVIDLRNNSGGNSAVLTPFLMAGLERVARFAQVKASVIIGRRTYSSALSNAVALKQAPVTLYGEPSGGSPTGYGEVLTLTLPNSQLRVSYSTRFYSYPDLPAGSLMPDVAVKTYSADYFARHDPFLAAVFAGTQPRQPVHASGNLTVTNAATFRAGEPVAPGSLVAMFGSFEGAGGVEVQIAGVAVPVLSASATQINLRIPVGTATGKVPVRVLRGGSEAATGAIDIAPSAPGLFLAEAMRTGHRIYGTGEGTPLPTRVYVGNEPAEVLYSGPQTDVPGLWQIDIRIPQTTLPAGPTPVFAVVGNSFSNAITIIVEN